MSDKELKNEFDELGREWSEAIVSNNADAIGRFMADEWLIVGETGFTNKNDFLAVVRSGDLTHEAMDGSVQRPVEALISNLEAGLTLEEFLENFPTVKREQALQVLDFSRATLQRLADAR